MNSQCLNNLAFSFPGNRKHGNLLNPAPDKKNSFSVVADSRSRNYGLSLSKRASTCLISCISSSSFLGPLLIPDASIHYCTVRTNVRERRQMRIWSWARSFL